MTAALAEPPVTVPESVVAVHDGCAAILRTLRLSRPGWRARTDIERLVDWGARDAVLARLVARGWAERTGAKGGARYRITADGRVWLHEVECCGIDPGVTPPTSTAGGAPELTLVEALERLDGRAVAWRGSDP